MRRGLEMFWKFLDEPMFYWTRFALALLVVPVIISFTLPLWHIRMTASQYPEGLDLHIYSYKVEGGHEGRDIGEINTLNHYIGMKKLDRSEFTDLDWLPFAFGALALLALRTAAIGNIRALIDFAVITFYVSSFAMGRFIYKLYSYGHQLDPGAPFKTEPFTPAIWGTKQIANFTTESYPSAGSYLIAVFITGIFAIAFWHLVAGRFRAVRRAQTPVS